jgi:hypothetical protein
MPCSLRTCPRTNRRIGRLGCRLSGFRKGHWLLLVGAELHMGGTAHARELENRQGCKPLEGSNPSLSATSGYIGSNVSGSSEHGRECLRFFRARSAGASAPSALRQTPPPDQRRGAFTDWASLGIPSPGGPPSRVSPPGWKITVSCPVRRGGRAAEGAPLLREYGVKPIEGSNPSLSATSEQRAQLAAERRSASADHPAHRAARCRPGHQTHRATRCRPGHQTHRATRRRDQRVLR